MVMMEVFLCFTALTCVVAGQELVDHHSFINASRVSHSGSHRQLSAANVTEPGLAEVLLKTKEPYETLSSQNHDEILVLSHTLAIHGTNTTKEGLESFQKQGKFDVTVSDFTKGSNSTDKSNQRISIPRSETLSPELESPQISAVVRDVEIASPEPAQVSGEPETSTYVDASRELPRPQQRVIESRMAKPEIHNHRIGIQETQDLKTLSGHFRSISSVPRKVVEEIKTKFEHIEPITYHSQSNHRDNHQIPSRQTLQATERTSRLPSRGPVFDFAKFPRLDHPKVQRLQVTKFLNRNVTLQSGDLSRQMTNGSSFSRTSQPIAFRLNGRGRSPIRYPQRNRKTHPHRNSFKGNRRSRSFVHHVRPSRGNHHKNSTGSETSGSLSLPKSQDRLNDSTDSIPREESDQVSTTKPFQLEPPSTQETPLLTTYPNQRVPDNFTISLEHARKLFARAQERYKNLSTDNPQVKARNAASNVESTIDPDQQYSISYSKISLNNGSVFLEDNVSSTTASSLTTESLVSGSEIIISPSTEYQTTPIYITTLSPSIISSEPSHQQQSHYFDKKAEYNSSLFDNERSLLEKYDHTADLRPEVSTEDLSDVLSKIDPDAAKYNTTDLDSDSDDVIHVTQQDDITKAEPIQLDANNDSILSKPTLSVPLSKITPYQSTLFPSLQNFNLFGNGNSNQQQQSAFPPVPRLATASIGNQPPNLSNLFGLGSLLGTGSLNTNLGGLGSFSLGQSFSNLNSDSNQQTQQSGTGVGGPGYLSLLSGLSGLDLGHLGRSSSPELSLPSLSQDSSSQQSNAGLGLLSGLSSVNLGGLGGFGGLGSLGNVGSIPSLSGLGNIMGTSVGSLDGLTGLNGFGLTRDGLNKFSVGSENVGALGARSSITPIFGKPSIPVGQLSVVNHPGPLGRDAHSIGPTIGGVAPELNGGAGSPQILSSVDTKVPASSPSVKTVKK